MRDTGCLEDGKGEGSEGVGVGLRYRNRSQTSEDAGQVVHLWGRGHFSQSAYEQDLSLGGESRLLSVCLTLNCLTCLRSVGGSVSQLF